MVKILIFRILGNDLQGLHGEDQTFTNLKFTLENETKFPNTTKMFLLNRIYDLDKKNKIIKLLESNNYKYIEIPFDLNEYKKISYDKNIDKLIKNHKNVRSNKNIFIGLREHNLYLVNNNGSRNYCIEYGKKEGYDWVFPLDSNSYFTDYHFKEIYKILKKDNKVEYLIIPQVRIAKGKLKNEDIFSSRDIIENLTTNEPQIAFKNSSKIKFNSGIPYGAAPKAELLRVLGVPGIWENWNDNKKYYDIEDRPKKNVNYKLVSKVIRLNPQEKNNGKDNFNNRMIGLYRFVKYIREKELLENNIIESFDNINKSQKKINLKIKNLLILVLLVYIFVIVINKKKITKDILFIIFIIVLGILVYKDDDFKVSNIKKEYNVREYFLNNINKVKEIQKPDNWNKLPYGDKIKIYGDNLTHEHAIFADKYRVKNIINSMNIKHLYVPKLVKLLDKKNDNLNLDELPSDCVIKTNNGWNDIIIIKNNKIIKMIARGKRISNSVNNYKKWKEICIKPHIKKRFQHHYKYIEPEILVEEYLGDNLTDYKFFCFNGNTKILQVDKDRFNGHTRNLYDNNFNLLPFNLGNKSNNYETKKYKNFEKMKYICNKIASLFEFARIDLYNINGKIYFGEITLTPGACNEPFKPLKYDYMVGNYWK